MEYRVKDGRSKSEAIHILKRYVAREVYRYLPRVWIPGPWTWLTVCLWSRGTDPHPICRSMARVTNSLEDA
jgi:hypothetical protein